MPFLDIRKFAPVDRCAHAGGEDATTLSMETVQMDFTQELIAR